MKSEVSKFCPLCHDIDEETISEILSFAREVKFKDNETIYMQGEEFRGVYVVIDGELRVTSQNEKGKEFLVHRYGAGDMFGLSGFVQKNYLESARSTTSVSCIFLPATPFKELIAKKNHLSTKVVQLFGCWILDFYERFQTLSFTSVRDRVEQYLMNELKTMDGPVVVLKLKRHEIASNLGIRSETLSRVLTTLQNENLIKFKASNEIDLSGLKTLTR